MVYDIFGQNVVDYSGASLERENVYRGGQLLAVIETPTAAAPTNLTAAPSGNSSTPSITLNWSGGAAYYRVERSTSKDGPYLPITNISSNTTVDWGVTTGNAYLYRVCASDVTGNCTSSYTNLALGAAAYFTDDPIVTYAENPGTETSIKKVHITELRTAVDAVRTVAGLPGGSWTHTTLTQQVTEVTAADVNDLRTALDAALNDLHLSTSTAYTDVTLATGASGTVIQKVHFTELRTRATSNSGTTSSGNPTTSNVKYVLQDGKARRGRS